MNTHCFLLANFCSLNNDLANNINGAIQDITSGSFTDITRSGVYYVRNAVTDKPSNTGGLYVFGYATPAVSVGLYIANNTAAPYILINGSISYRLSTVSATSLAAEEDVPLVDDSIED